MYFQDQVQVERGDGARRVYCWRFADEKYQQRFLKPEHKGKDISEMIMGFVSGEGRGPIIVMKRDPESKKNGFTANSYRWAMEEALPQLPTTGFYLLQDNAPIHTAKKSRAWIKEQKITWVRIPANSPDLNVIENAWPHLETLLVQNHHNILWRGDSLEVRKEFTRSIISSWDFVSNDYCKALVESMPRRVRAVLAVQGWHTRY